ncbi:MAG: hypothetical protein WA208_18690 [Thermoanaerobaculia bacterium]
MPNSSKNNRPHPLPPQSPAKSKVLQFPCDQEPDGLDNVNAGLTHLRTALAEYHDALRDLVCLTSILLHRTTDTTHITIEEAARYQMVCTKTIRNRIKQGKLTLEVIPGTNRSGIPVKQLSSGWVDMNRAKAILRRRAAVNG